MSTSLPDLAEIANGTLKNPSNAAANSVTASSRDVTPNSVFVAIRGTAQDGHRWVDDALDRGAVAAVVEDQAVLGSNPGIVVQNSRWSLSALAAHFAGEPAKKLKLIGITGTNGKTTTNWLVCHALTALASPCARIGTLGMVFGATKLDSLTTPDPVALHTFLAAAVAQGAASAVLEVSSHGLDQDRVEHIPFDVGIFTNLTRDHLDYHGTIEKYRAAKMRLFNLVAKSGRPGGVMVVNLDSEYGPGVRSEGLKLGLRDLSFGSNADSPVQILSFVEEPERSVLRLSILDKEVSVRSKLVGRHNAENLTCAVCACVAIGFEPQAVAEALALIPQVPGRLQRVGDKGPRVFVDYAHTPDAMERAITALRPSTTGKLWVLFGCGGDRDKGKRPQMAAVAERLADKVVVTSDNPRTEDPQRILEDILSGGLKAELVEVDRRKAIERTLADVSDEDTVLIAGKGAEDYQIIGTEKKHFSDLEEAEKGLSSRRKTGVIG